MTKTELHPLVDALPDESLPAAADPAAVDLRAVKEARIEVRPAALKSLRKLGRKDRERIATAIGGLPEGDAAPRRTVARHLRSTVE